ncbi:MAG: hypothetical protein HY236_06630 [Acidobacteria bacterium]|nr:hypothetical protein [Acidobacteriota bacterium]
MKARWEYSMTTQILAVVLTALLSGNCFGRTQSSNRPSPKEQVRAIDTRSPVEVRFIDGSKLRGWIGEVSDTGFVLSHEKKRQLTNSQVAFNQIKAVKQVKSVKPSHTARNVLIGVGITVVAIGIIFGIFVASHPLG